MTVVFIMAAIFGNYAIVDISILGIVPTYYRVLIPVIMQFIYFLIFGLDGEEKMPLIVNPEDMLAAQMENMSQSAGTMYMRINTYIESMKEMFLQSKGLGLGAGSFSNYFADIADERDMMLNPHALWIEILSQYGLIVFLFTGSRSAWHWE